MKIFNIFKKYEKLKFALGLIIVGLIITVIAGFICLKPSDNYKEIKATITSIKLEEIDESENENYTVTVKYEVNGKEYENVLGAYESSWKVGDIIDCEYDINDPNEIQSKSGLFTIIIGISGVFSLFYGIYLLVKGFKTPSSKLSQYDRVNEDKIDTHIQEKIKNNKEPVEEYIFHFTGKFNQSYVMEDVNGNPVFEATCEGVKLIKDTKYTFKNYITSKENVKMISHTISTSLGNENFSNTISSSFKIDGINCWDVIANMGYGFKFSLNGLKAHYEVEHMKVSIGFAEATGMNSIKNKKSYKVFGKIPTNGIYKIKCSKSDIEALFLICFCLSKTDLTLT